MLPRQNAEHENVLANDDVIGSRVQLPASMAGARGRYHHKVLDRRSAWTPAGQRIRRPKMDGDVCQPRVVLGGVAPIPWRLPEVEKMLVGQRITEELAAKGGRGVGHRRARAPEERLQIPLTKGVVRRTILEAQG